MSESVEQMKSKLQKIVELARLRRERIEVAETTPELAPLPESPSLIARVKKLLAAEPEPPSQEPPAPVVETEAPLGWIEVKALQWRWIDGFPVKNGYESHARPRTEADGDAEYVIFNTPPPKPAFDDGTPIPAEEKVSWPSWGETGRTDPRIRRQTSRNWSWAGDNRNAAYHDWKDQQESK